MLKLARTWSAPYSPAFARPDFRLDGRSSDSVSVMRRPNDLAAHVRRAARGIFRLLARFWELLPRSFTRKIPFQIMEVMSIRPTKHRSVQNSLHNLTGLLARGSSIVFFNGQNFVSQRRRPNSLYAAMLISPDATSGLSPALYDIEESTLVVGGLDATFPEQIDKRFPLRSAEEIRDLFQGLSRFEKVYAENLVGYGPNLNPIPGGITSHPWRGSVVFAMSRPRLKAPRNLVFCAHKTRRGSEQWDTRRRVTELARGPWASFTTVQSGRSTLREFRRELQRHPFTLCVEGGGIDPSPKAFEALLRGSIPIIRESEVADAYRHFPVLVIPEWEARHLSPAILRKARADLLGDWQDWTDVLERLSMRYWRDLIIRGESTRLIFR